MNAYNIRQISNVLNKIEPEKGDKWSVLSDEEKINWLKNNENLLEQKQHWTDTFTSVEDAVNPNKKLTDLAKIYDTYKGQIPSDARMATILKPYKNGELTAEEINDYFNKTNQYKEDEIKAREYEAGRTRRSNEVKNWNMLQNLLANDYSKQRYIDNPDASIFGEEGQFNPYSTEGQEELRDVILGGTGSVAEVMPGIGGVIGGPVIRASRDAYHKYGDSPYKPQESILKNMIMDIGVNAGVNYAPTAILKRTARMSNNIGETSNKINTAIRAANIEKETKDIYSSMNDFDNFLSEIKDPYIHEKQRGVYRDVSGGMTKDIALNEWTKINDYIQNLPDNRATAEIKQLWKSNLEKVATGDNESMYKLYKAIRNWKDASGLSPVKFENYVKKYDVAPTKTPATEFYLERVATPKLSNLQKAVKYGYKNIGPIGEPSVRLATNVDNPVESNERPQIEWYKQNYDRDWRMGFKPKEDNSALWQAYQEWLQENK